MTYKLFFRGRHLSTHTDIEDARAQARWTYFEFTCMGWDGENTPPGFLILCENPHYKALNSQDNKVVCS